MSRVDTAMGSRMQKDVFAARATVPMMRNPQWWCHYPRLPLKRRRGAGQDTEMGVMLAIDNPARYDVYLGLLFLPLDPEKVIHYASPEEAAADGWEVD